MFLSKYPAELSRIDIWRTRDQLAAHVITWTFRQAYMRFAIFYSIHFITWNDMKLLSKMSNDSNLLSNICPMLTNISYMLSKIIPMMWKLHSCRHRCCDVIKIGKVRRDMAAEDSNTTTNLQIAITIGTELQASTRWNHSKIIRTYYYAISHPMLLFFRENITKVSSPCDSIFSNMIGLNAKREVKDDNRWYR